MSAGLTYWITVGVRDGASAPVTGVGKALEGNAKAAAAASGAFAKLGKAGVRHVTEVGNAAKAAGRDTKDLGNSAKDAGDKGAGGLDRLARAGTGARGAVSRLCAAMRDLAKEGDKLKKLGEAFDKLKNAGTKVMAVGAGMTAPLAAAGYAAMGHESRKLAIDLPFTGRDGTNKLDQYDDLTARAAGRGGRSGLDAREALAAALRGQMTGDALRAGGMDAIMDLADVHGVSAKASADLLAGLGDNFKVSDGDYSRIAGYVSAAAQEGGASGVHGSAPDGGLESFAGVLAGLGTKARGLGIGGAKGVEGMAILTTMLKKSGMDDGAAGASLGGLLETLPTMGMKTMNSTAFMSETVKGILHRSGLEDITKGLFDKGSGELIGSNGAEKLFTLTKFFGDIGEKVGDAQDRLILLKTVLPGIADDAAKAMTTDGWDAAAKAINDHQALQEQAARVRESAAKKWDTLKASVAGTAASIGGQLLPIAKSLMDRASAVMDRIKAWTEAHPGLTKAMAIAGGAAGLLVTAAGGLMFGVGVLGSAITRGIRGFETWSGLLTTAKAKVVLLGNESAIAAAKTRLLDVAGGFKRGFANPLGALKGKDGPGFWAGAKKGSDRLRSGIRGGAGRALGGVKALGRGDTWKAAGKGLMSGAKGLGKGLVSALALPFKALGGVFAGVAALGWPVIAVIAAIAAAALLVYKYWDPIKKFFQGVWKGIKDGAEAFKEPWEKLKGAVRGIWDAFASIVRIFVPLKAGQDGANGAFAKGESVGKALAKVLGWICTGAKWVAMYLEGVVFVIVTLVDTIVSAGKTIWHFFTGQWGKLGDDWKDMGRRTAERFKNLSWMKAGEDKALAAAANTEATASADKAKKAETKAAAAEDEARRLRREAERARADAKAAEAKARKAGAEADVKAAREAEERAKAAEDRAKGAERKAKEARLAKAITDKAKGGDGKEDKALKKLRARHAKERRQWQEKLKNAAPGDRKALGQQYGETMRRQRAELKKAEADSRGDKLKAAADEAAAAKARLQDAGKGLGGARKRLTDAKKGGDMGAIAKAEAALKAAQDAVEKRLDEKRVADGAQRLLAAKEDARLELAAAEDAARKAKGFRQERAAGKRLAAAKGAMAKLTGADATAAAAGSGATDGAALGTGTAPATSGGTEQGRTGQTQPIQQPQSVQNNQTNTTTINSSPTIHLHGNATPDDERRFSALLKRHKEELARLVNEVNERNRRWSPGAGAA